MRKFTLKLAVFLGIFLIFDRAVGYFLQTQRPIDYKLFLQSKTDFFETNEAIDLLIIGDSHVADAIDSRTIEKKTFLKAYNLGIYHSSPFENYYMTKAALEELKQKPKMIVLGTNPIMFEKSLSKGKYTPLILPFPYSLQLAKNSDEGFDIAFFLHTIREKYLVKSIFNQLRRVNYNPTRVIKDVYNGHLKFYNQIPNTEWYSFENAEAKQINQRQVEYFSKTIELALKSNIKVIIVHPPLWKHHLQTMSSGKSFYQFTNIINHITAKYNLKTYYNYLNEDFMDSLNFEKEDFLNTQHLNYYGSRKFTRGFSDFLLD